MTQTGQPGPWTRSIEEGSKILEAVLVDRVRVAAAHFHDLEGPTL